MKITTNKFQNLKAALIKAKRCSTFGFVALLFTLTFQTVTAQLPTEFERVELKTGLKNAVSFKFAPDGRAFIIDRFGELLIYKPDILNTVSAGTIDVFSELEDGLIGIALDPNFSSNNYIYLHYSPLSVSVNRVSRFTMNGDQLNMGSEVVMMEWATQRVSCCHSGGDMDFDSQGNLYIATGDNTQHSDFAPLDEVDSFNSAEKSSSNTQDLRGKILRITPQPNGSYSIPPGNLFASSSDGLPEIYVMGARNPYRIFVDKDNTDWLFWGEVGPDSNNSSSPFGPEGRDEINLTKQAENAGWPYFSGQNEPYQNTYASPTFYWNPNNPVNVSTWNTGLTNLPAAQPAWLDFFHKCYLAGPRYYFDASLTSQQRLPIEFDGVFFYYDFNTSRIWAVQMDAQGTILSNQQLSPDVFPNTKDGFIDMKIGPDGHLYLLEYGTGCCANNSGTGKFVRVNYTGIVSNSSPMVELTATPTNGSLPLTVNFSSAGTFDPDGDPITYEWDFDGDGNTDSTAPNPTHTYTVAGNFEAQLKVTDSENNVSAESVTIVAGNNAANFTFISPPDGGLIGWGDDISIDLEVTDVEDGTLSGGGIDCQDVNLIPSLGHLNHFHDDNTLDGCAQPFTLGFEGHDIYGEMDIFYVFGVNYTDSGGLQSFDQIQLHPKRKEAEYFDDSNSVSVIDNSDLEGGGSEAIRVNRNGYISFDGRNLQNITGVKYRVASPNSNGRIELRTGSPTGTILAITSVPNTGGTTNWVDVETNFTDPGGKNDLYFVFKNDGVSQAIFDLNYIEFIGAGVSVDNSPPELNSVFALSNTSLEVELSEEVNQSDAENTANYSINGVSVTGALLQGDGRTVTLTINPGLSLGQTYTVNVSGIRNLAGLNMNPASESITFGQTIRLNSGGPTLTFGSETFEADQYVTGASTFTSVVPISGTNNDALYQTENFGDFTYEIPVSTSGLHDVRLHFAELFFTSSNQRIFDVLIEGQTVISGLDIFSEVGKDAALIRNINDIDIADGVLSLSFNAIQGNPKLSAIEVLPPNTFDAQPSINIVSPDDFAVVSQPFSVAFSVENWNIAVGDTHMHYFVDGVMVGPHYSTDPIVFTSLPEGQRTIRLELFNANHTGSGVFDEVIVNVISESSQTEGRINAGGPAYTGSGLSWEADNYFPPNSETYTNNVDIAGTDDDQVYQTERWDNGSLQANIPVADGAYNVRLHFAELYYGPVVAGGAGKRVFDIDVEGQFQQANYDITVSAGGAATADVIDVSNIDVTDGNLTITLTGVVDNPKISGIEFFPAGSSQPPVANAGSDLTISLPTNSVTINGSGSDPDGGNVTYQWTQISGPTTASLGGATTANLNASNLFQGTYVFQLAVTDDENETTNDQVAVTVLEESNCIDLPFPDQWTTHEIDSELPFRSIYILPHHDLDGDGLKDIVTGAWWYKNPGTAGGNWVRRTIGAPFNNVAFVYDFDGDNDMDLLGTEGDYTGSDLIWAENDGNGNFTIRTNIPAGTNTYTEPFLAGIAGGVFSNGGPFQMALNWNGSDQTGDPMQLLTPTANPASGTWTIETLSNDALGEDVKAVDIDGDGDLDLFQSENWLRNDLSTGGGWTTIPTGISYSTTPDRVQMADFDKDGNVDAVIGQLGLGGGDKFEFAWWKAPDNPENPWTKQVLANDIEGSLSVYVQDIDFDGDDDIVVGEWRGPERLIAFENDLCNTGSWIRHVIDGGGQGFDHHDGAQVTDIDNDGDFDVVSIGWDNITPRIFENLSGPPSDTPPVANAGDDQLVIIPESTVQLTGSGVDPDGGEVSFLWTQSAGPNTAALNGQTTSTLNVSNLIQGTYIFTLTVTDDENDTDSDDVVVTVSDGAAVQFARINAGGPSYTFNGDTWDADQYFSAETDTFENVVEIAGTNDDQVYQTERYSTNGVLVYEIPVAEESYDVNLHFAELFWGVERAGGVGNRSFNIDIENGQFQQNNFDTTAEAGGAATAVVVNATNIIVTDGFLTVTLTAVVGDAHIHGIEVLGAGSNPVPPIADAGPDQSIVLPVDSVTLFGTAIDPDGGEEIIQWTQISGPNTAFLLGDTTPDLIASGLTLGTYEFELSVTDDEGLTETDRVFVSVSLPGAQSAIRLNAGGPSYTFNGDTWDADQYFSTSDTFENAITIANTTDQQVYQTERWIEFENELIYSIPVANRRYNVNLHFAELYWDVEKAGGVGSRVFDYDIEGQFQETGYDIIERAGAAATAIVESYTNVIVQDGFLTITLTRNVGDPKISGIEIFPVNEAPVAIATASATSGNAPLNVNFTGGNSVDENNDIVSYLWDFGTGDTSIVPNPQYEFTTPGTYNVTLTVTDGDGLTGSTSLTITVNGAPVAVAEADVTSGNPPLTVNFTGSNSTDDFDEIVSYAWDFGTGDTSIDDNPTYEFAAAGVYTVTLTVTDAGGLSSSDTVEIIVNGEPVAVAEADVTNGNVPLTVNFTGSNSTDDGNDIVSYAWDFGTGDTSTDADPQYEFTAAGVYTVSLTVTDGGGLVNTATLEITVNGEPVAVAEADVTTGNAPLTVNFTGSNSTDDFDDIVSYSWDFGTGDTSTDADPAYIFDQEGTYTVTLTVTDGGGLSNTATLEIMALQDNNMPPVARIDANPTVGDAPLPVIFDGSGSTDDAGIESYAWDFDDGTTSSEIMPVKTFDQPGEYFVRLTVTDERGVSDSATVLITVTDPNANKPPVAVISTSTTSGEAPLEVVFTGANSTDDDAIVSYSWSFGNGDTSNQINPTYTYTVPGTYNAVLTVVDGEGLTDSASITITVEQPADNEAPVAVVTATPTQGEAPVQVSFTGDMSTDDKGIVSYNWDFGDGASINEINPVHTYTGVGVFTATLTVTDEEGLTGSASIEITVDEPTENQAPIANASSDVTSGIMPLTVNFSSEGSVDDIGIVSYLWDFKDGSTSTQLNPTHTFTQAGVYAVLLTVTDAEGLTDTDTVTINVETGNLPPLAAVSADVTSGQAPLVVNFSSVGSSDDEGITEYFWDFDDGSTSAEANPTHTFTGVGTYNVTLTVRDMEGLSDTELITITVVPENQAPTSVLSASIIAGEAPLQVQFTGSNSTDDKGIVEYFWDFDDGFTSTEQNPIHTFTFAGTFQVVLRVEDEEGLSDSNIVTVTVTDNDPFGGGTAMDLVVVQNPASQIVDLVLNNRPSNAVVVKLYLHDSSGRLIRTFEPQQVFSDGHYMLPVYDLRDEMYYVTVEMLDGLTMGERFLIKNE